MPTTTSSNTEDISTLPSPELVVRKPKKGTIKQKNAASVVNPIPIPNQTTKSRSKPLLDPVELPVTKKKKKTVASTQSSSSSSVSSSIATSSLPLSTAVVASEEHTPSQTDLQAVENPAQPESTTQSTVEVPTSSSSSTANETIVATTVSAALVSLPNPPPPLPLRVDSATTVDSGILSTPATLSSSTADGASSSNNKSRAAGGANTRAKGKKKKAGGKSNDESPIVMNGYGVSAELKRKFLSRRNNLA